MHTTQNEMSFDLYLCIKCQLNRLREDNENLIERFIRLFEILSSSGNNREIKYYKLTVEYKFGYYSTAY